MKLSFIEQLVINNPIRAFIQKYIECPILRKMGNRKKYPLCLEIGCGAGIGAQAIVEQFGAEQVIAIDIDPAQIKKAKRGLPSRFQNRIEFKKGDAMALDEPSDKFDAVFSFGVIHHLENWRNGIKEVARVLKRDGEFFFEEPFRPIAENILVRIFAPHPKGGEFNFPDFKDAMKRNDIEIIKMIRIANLAMLGVGRTR